MSQIWAKEGMLMIIVKEYLDDYYDYKDGDVDNDDLWETWVQISQPEMESALSFLFRQLL